MKKNALLLIGALALATVSFASPKSCEILLPQTVRAGQVQLAAGQYRVQVQGSNAVFTNVETARQFMAPVKIENAQKHEVTAVEVQKDGDSSHITHIDFGGSNETLQFGE